jgi:hypothetical protein
MLFARKLVTASASNLILGLTFGIGFELGRLIVKEADRRIREEVDV